MLRTLDGVRPSTPLAFLLHARRTETAWLILLVAAGCTAPTAPPERSSTSQAPDAPNVLVVMSDDQRLGTMAVMPETREWFGRGGTRFRRAFATTPLCCPSRASIFTGRYAHNHGVLNNSLALELDHATTVQRYLHDAGYRTAIAGKFLNDWPLRVPPPHFDRYAITNGSYFETPFNVNGTMRTVTRYSTDFVAATSVEFLREFEEEDHRPWLLYVTPWAPHLPAKPPPRHRGAPVPPWQPGVGIFERDRSDKPPFVQASNESPERARRIRRDQLRTLMAVDDLVGRLRRTLADLGETRSTLAIFISDNGYFWGEHRLIEKFLPYSESVRVPLYVRWPGHIERGAVSDRIVANIDIAPTVLRAAGVSPEHTIDGRSLFASDRRSLLLEFWVEIGTTPDWASLWTPRSQYVEYYDEHGDVTFREGYDLGRDPLQLRNVLPRADDVAGTPVTQLTEQLADLRTCAGTEGEDACP
jgi:arylsulfatase A-like enzyme